MSKVHKASIWLQESTLKLGSISSSQPIKTQKIQALLTASNRKLELPEKSSPAIEWKEMIYYSYLCCYSMGNNVNILFMINNLLKSFFGKSNIPKSSSPVPRSITSMRLYISKNKRILRWPDGTFYDGECANETILQGKGKLCLPSGDFYEGEFCENQFHGIGKYTYSDGSFYHGEWKNDIKEGYGK